MSCRHDLALGTCKRCYPSQGSIDPGAEEEYAPNLEGIGAVTFEEHQKEHPEARQMATCCYCQAPVPVVKFHIPPGYANNPEHDGKPLCVACGSGPTPTLDEILLALDAGNGSLRA
jgi:hypothetical protein